MYAACTGSCLPCPTANKQTNKEANMTESRNSLLLLRMSSQSSFYNLTPSIRRKLRSNRPWVYIDLVDAGLCSLASSLVLCLWGPPEDHPSPEQKHPWACRGGKVPSQPSLLYELTQHYLCSKLQPLPVPHPNCFSKMKSISVLSTKPPCQWKARGIPGRSV